MACKVQMLLGFGSKHFFNIVSHTIITHSDTQVTTTDTEVSCITHAAHNYYLYTYQVQGSTL